MVLSRRKKHNLNPRKGTLKSHSLGSSIGWQLLGHPQYVALSCDHGIPPIKEPQGSCSGLRRGIVASLKKFHFWNKKTVCSTLLSFVLRADLASNWGQDFHLGGGAVKTSPGLLCHFRCLGPMFTLTPQAESCLLIFFLPQSV